MKLFYIGVLEPQAGGKWDFVAEAEDFTSFSFFTRSSIRDFARFSADLMVQRTDTGLAQGIVNESTSVAGVN